MRIVNWPGSTIKGILKNILPLFMVQHLFLIKQTYITSLTDNLLLQLFVSSVSAI